MADKIEDVIHEVKDGGWHLFGQIYANPDDQRVIVPRRPSWTGWTLNLARPLSWAIIIALLLLGFLLRPRATE